MANEYAVNQSDLVQVANAIRTKGETSGELVFPSGFVDAIQNIETGAELNYTLQAFATYDDLPEVVEENTIGVNTSTPITSHVFSAEEPNEPSQGMVWFRTGLTSETEFAPYKDIAITVSPIWCCQYENGAWADKGAGIYLDNEWKIFRKFLFNNGDACKWLTGGWTATSSGSFYEDYVQTPSDAVDTLSLKTKSSEQYGVLTTVNSIDFSNVNQVRIKGAISLYGSNVYCAVVLKKENSDSEYIFWNPTTRVGDFEMTEDASEASGKYHVSVLLVSEDVDVPLSSSVQISEIELL